jgi:hypothetical protein
LLSVRNPLFAQLLTDEKYKQSEILHASKGDNNYAEGRKTLTQGCFMLFFSTLQPCPNAMALIL